MAHKEFTERVEGNGVRYSQVWFETYLAAIHGAAGQMVTKKGLVKYAVEVADHACLVLFGPEEKG